MHTIVSAIMYIYLSQGIIKLWWFQGDLRAVKGDEFILFGWCFSYAALIIYSVILQVAKLLTYLVGM